MGFNFNAFEGVTYPVTLELKKKEMDLHLQSPSLEEYEDFIARATGKTDSRTLASLCADILSDNTEGVQVEPEDLRPLPMAALCSFINDYFVWLRDTRNAKN